MPSGNLPGGSVGYIGGCGNIGDWVCHVVDPVFWAAELGSPTAITASTPALLARRQAELGLPHDGEHLVDGGQRAQERLRIARPRRRTGRRQRLAGSGGRLPGCQTGGDGGE